MSVTTVGELLDFLSTQPRDRLVVMSSDTAGEAGRTVVRLQPPTG